jgi:hypothetical protein
MRNKSENKTMKLDEFITGTLISIIKGIKDAQDFAKENGSTINPSIGQWDKNKILTTYKGNEHGIYAINTIDFDIAITTSNAKELGGEGGIGVYAMKLGGKISDIDKNENVSRIKFGLNIVLPKMEL